MEIELQNVRLPKTLLLAVCTLCTVVLLGLVGRNYTTLDANDMPRLLSWSDWQFLRAERAYRTELGHLQHEADQLQALLNAAPDPVRAQISADRIERQYASGAATLAHPRELLLQASRAVRDWASGVTSLETAQAALQAAYDALTPAD